VHDAEDAFLDEDRGVVGDAVIDAFGERRLEPFERAANLLGAVERVAARRLIDADHRGGLAVQAADRFRKPRSKLDAGDVAHPHERAVRVGAHDHGTELLDGRQAALGLDADLKLLVGQRRLRTDASDRGLDVLALQSVGDIARHQTEIRQPLAVEPDLHAVVGR
jgi:hypothetical protein